MSPAKFLSHHLRSAVRQVKPWKFAAEIFDMMKKKRAPLKVPVKTFPVNFFDSNAASRKRNISRLIDRLKEGSNSTENWNLSGNGDDRRD